MLSSKGDQGLAVELQKLECTSSHDESSSDPAFRNFIAGFSSTKLTTGEPQLGQKPLLMWEPAEPVTVKNFKLPLISSCSAGMMIIVALPEPVDF